jgi:hypothetical protein
MQHVRQVSTLLSFSCILSLSLAFLVSWSRVQRPSLLPRGACVESSLGTTLRMGSRMMKSASEKKKSSRSDRKNSWVMLADGAGGYTPLPGEQTLYQSPPRTTLSLQTSHRHPPSESYSQQCKSGVVYLTNRRVRHPTIAGATASSNRYADGSLDHLPSRHTNTSPPILCRAHPQRRRLPRNSTMVWSEQVGSPHTTCLGRRHPTAAR